MCWWSLPLRSSIQQLESLFLLVHFWTSQTLEPLMKKNDEAAAVLEQVDSRRRGFLRKLLAGGAAMAALPAMSTVVLAENGQAGGGKGKGAKGKGGGKGKGAKGKGGKGSGGRPDPSRMAAELIKRFDKDGDNALNARELAQALTAMRDRFRSGQGKGSGRPGKGRPGKGKGSN